MSGAVAWIGGPFVGAQFAVVLAGAVLTAAAAWVYGSAADEWQRSVRVEVQRAQSVQQATHFVYTQEALNAFRILALEERASALRPLAATNRLATTESAVAEQSAFALRQAEQAAKPGNELLTQQRYRESGGLNVLLRVKDLTTPADAAPDSDAVSADGDARARSAVLLLVGIILTAALAVTIALWPRRQPAPTELFPQPAQARPRQRRTATLLLTAWAAGVLLPALQLALSTEAQRSQADAARLAVRLTSTSAAGLNRSGFAAHRMAREFDVQATARRIGALRAATQDADDENAVAGVEETVAAQLVQVAARMGRAPLLSDGLPADVQAALAATCADWRVPAGWNGQTPNCPEWEALGDQQKRTADRADRYGQWANYVLVLIAVVILVAALTDLWAAARARRLTPP